MTKGRTILMVLLHGLLLGHYVQTDESDTWFPS